MSANRFDRDRAAPGYRSRGGGGETRILHSIRDISVVSTSGGATDVLVPGERRQEKDEELASAPEARKSLVGIIAPEDCRFLFLLVFFRLVRDASGYSILGMILDFAASSSRARARARLGEAICRALYRTSIR